MPNIVNQFKEELGNAFSSMDARRDDEGANAYRDFNNSVSEEFDTDELEEKWSEKYKRSIDCNNPKGFSQKAHCQGRKKKENKESTGAASAGSYSAPLFGDVEKMETKEATGASSAGQYSGPSIWAKSTNKKDWAGKRKTQIPGGKFVTIKKKCKKFPYCNQGDINALKIYENKMVKKIITKISNEHNISENVIKAVIQYEIEKQQNK